MDIIFSACYWTASYRATAWVQIFLQLLFLFLSNLGVAPESCICPCAFLYCHQSIRLHPLPSLRPFSFSDESTQLQDAASCCHKDQYQSILLIGKYTGPVLNQYEDCWINNYSGDSSHNLVLSYYCVYTAAIVSIVIILACDYNKLHHWSCVVGEWKTKRRKRMKTNWLAIQNSARTDTAFKATPRLERKRKRSCRKIWTQAVAL